MKVDTRVFGDLTKNEEAHLFTISNNNGVTISITNFGGIIPSIIVPDRKGNPDDIVLGFETLREYLDDHPYIGSLVGRYANRISKGRFTLDDKEYRLVQNHGENHLHGGVKGFDKLTWDFSEYADRDRAGVMLDYVSHDMEEGYPGKLTVRVNFSLNEDNELTIEYSATTDQPTPINLTHHGYFNLNGARDTIYDHKLFIHANKYIVTDDDLIPTGEIKEVAGTALDFRVPKLIGQDIGKVPGGYDHCYVIKREGLNPELAARVSHPESGRIMEVYTTEPGIQFYSSNFLEGLTGKGKIEYRKHLALCLETQHFPDSVNQPHFPTTILRPGETYKQLTIYKFLTDA